MGVYGCWVSDFIFVGSGLGYKRSLRGFMRKINWDCWGCIEGPLEECVDGSVGLQLWDSFSVVGERRFWIVVE